MHEFEIDPGTKAEIDARMEAIFIERASVKSELQDGGAFILISAELGPSVLAREIFGLSDEAEDFLNSFLPIRGIEPRWMLCFKVKGRILFGCTGGLKLDL